VLVSADGDFACCQTCADEFYRQRDNFFDTIIDSDEEFNKWLTGE
jgi:hypothetical protein